LRCKIRLFSNTNKLFLSLFLKNLYYKLKYNKMGHKKRNDLSPFLSCSAFGKIILPSNRR
jgi:hypothetical protein